jgi:hypothetical protein
MSSGIGDFGKQKAETVIGAMRVVFWKRGKVCLMFSIEE